MLEGLRFGQKHIMISTLFNIPYYKSYFPQPDVNVSLQTKRTYNIVRYFTPIPGSTSRPLSDPLHVMGFGTALVWTSFHYNANNRGKFYFIFNHTDFNKECGSIMETI